jgi:uncharacterized protein (TIGR00369 family)
VNEQKVREIFSKANFVNDLGIQIDELSLGQCQTHLKILPKHLQQTNVVHAGVLATLADHTAGGAAATHLKEDEFILSIEFKISLFRPAHGELLKCRSKVLKPGKSVIFTESEIFSVLNHQETLVSKTSVTLAVLKQRKESS